MHMPTPSLNIRAVPVFLLPEQQVTEQEHEEELQLLVYRAGIKRLSFKKHLPSKSEA